MTVQSSKFKIQSYNSRQGRGSPKAAKFKVKIFFFLLILTTFNFSLLTFNFTAQAVMKSPDYELQMPNLNFAAGNIGSTDFKLGFTGGQNAPGPYSSTGYRVLAGFWYIKTIIPFSFSLSNTLVDFGSLSSGIPQTATTTLTVSAGGAGGYQITVEEDHQLLVDSIGAIIPDTTGDNGNITETTANVWNSNTTYGFGYTMYGNDVPTPFPTASPAGTDYKQFADISKNEIPQVVMQSFKVGKNRTSTLTYKINVAPEQATGQYHNVITFIATPGY